MPRACQLEGATHRRRLLLAEQHGARKRGTEEDLRSVYEWSVQIRGGPAYVIGPFPYRLDGTYVSPTFRGDVLRYRVKEIPSSLPAHKRAVAVEIAGGYLPDARMTRRDDWGWELRSHMLVARSVTHRRQPESREEMRALVGEWHREQARRHQEQQVSAQ